MTNNQLTYWKNKEDERAHRASETETNRSNLAREFETNRSNVAKERETHRSNLMNEFFTGRNTAVNERNASTNETNAISNRMNANSNQVAAQAKADKVTVDRDHYERMDQLANDKYYNSDDWAIAQYYDRKTRADMSYYDKLGAIIGKYTGAASDITGAASDIGKLIKSFQDDPDLTTLQKKKLEAEIKKLQNDADLAKSKLPNSGNATDVAEEFMKAAGGAAGAAAGGAAGAKIGFDLGKKGGASTNSAGRIPSASGRGYPLLGPGDQFDLWNSSLH